MPPTTGADFAGDERWGLVTRVTASRLFGKAAQLRELLLFLAEKAIASPAVEITEQEIGSRVLGRRPDYDPQSDNIVRVQIRRLRQKLEEYFVADGLHEPMVIAIPKGSHVLRFERRPEQDRGAPPRRFPRRVRPAGSARRPRFSWWRQSPFSWAGFPSTEANRQPGGRERPPQVRSGLASSCEISRPPS
jgi:hypothetical protein